MVLNTLIEDLEDGIESTLGKAVDGTSLRGKANAVVGKTAIERDLERLKKWAVSNSATSRCNR